MNDKELMKMVYDQNGISADELSADEIIKHSIRGARAKSNFTVSVAAAAAVLVVGIGGYFAVKGVAKTRLNAESSVADLSQTALTSDAASSPEASSVPVETPNSLISAYEYPAAVDEDIENSVFIYDEMTITYSRAKLSKNVTDLLAQWYIENKDVYPEEGKRGYMETNDMAEGARTVKFAVRIGESTVWFSKIFWFLNSDGYYGEEKFAVTTVNASGEETDTRYFSASDGNMSAEVLKLFNDVFDEMNPKMVQSVLNFQQLGNPGHAQFLDFGNISGLREFKLEDKEIAAIKDWYSKHGKETAPEYPDAEDIINDCQNEPCEIHLCIMSDDGCRIMLRKLYGVKDQLISDIGFIFTAFGKNGEVINSGYLYDEVNPDNAMINEIFSRIYNEVYKNSNR